MNCLSSMVAPMMEDNQMKIIKTSCKNCYDSSLPSVVIENEEDPLKITETTLFLARNSISLPIRETSTTNCQDSKRCQMMQKMVAKNHTLSSKSVDSASYDSIENSENEVILLRLLYMVFLLLILSVKFL